MSLSKPVTRNQKEHINDADRVVVVAAGSALEEYKRCSAYICLPNRTFQHCVRMAFYTKNKVYYKVPKIIGQPIEAISAQEIETRTDLSDAERGRLRTLLKNMDSQRREGWNTNRYKIFFLTSPDSPDTLTLQHDIENDQMSGNGRHTAFTQGQRYISLTRLEKGPKNTSELV